MIRVAVIDQGVDLDHPDLAANLLPGFDATDGGDGGTNGDCWANDAHGTCCAGIIAAVNNTIGTIGVAHNCRIIPIRVSYTRNNIQIWNDDWMVNAINHAWDDDNADVLSCSWGGGTSVAAVNNEISAALNQGRNTQGCIVVFSTGNNNTTVAWPANSNLDIIAVGAMSPCGERKNPNSCDNEDWYRPYPYNDYLGGSNYGNELDVIAPGVFVPTSDIQGSAGYNTTSGTGGNYHQTFNGTSSATPHVAGVAALILSINPSLTQDQVRDIIESTCTKVGSYNYSTVTGRGNGTWNNEVGYGCVNAFAAISRVLGGPISGSSVICTSGTTLSITPPAAFDSIVWTCGPNLVISSGQNTNSCNLSATSNGSSWVRARLVSACGSITLPAKTVWAGTPVVTSLTGTSPIGVYQPANYYLGISDYASSPDSYSWGTSPLPGVSITSYGNYASIMFTQPGYYQVVAKAHNACGWSDYGVKMVTVISGYKLAISPNPSTSETAISLVTETNEVAQITTDWDCEIYDSFQGLKEKKTKLKASETKINTSNWKEGVYIVRATIADQVITEKLLVKH